MTHPTKAIYKWMLSDFVRVSNVANNDEQPLYNDAELSRSYERINTIDYHQEIEVDGIRFTALNAGHVLGAAMFVIEVAGVRLLYTGDYSREEDRHLMAAEVPKDKPDVMICESTYGVSMHQPRLERERRFTGMVHDVVRRGGRCLIPVFALGRAQELLLILDEYWQAHPELHAIPIYYASPMAHKCMAVYQTYVNMMNEHIRKQIAISNPFIFKHIKYLRGGREAFKDAGPCVMFASPGMLQNGLSRELLELWAPSKANGLVVPGYVVDGTMGKFVLSEPKEIHALKTGLAIPLRMSVDYISFSAHVDFAQNAEFIDLLLPPHLILVHGEQAEMGRLRAALTHKYAQRQLAQAEEDEDDDDRGKEKKPIISIYTPRNCETVSLSFAGEKMIKLAGRLAKHPREASSIEGVLVGKDFDYNLVHPDDIHLVAPSARNVKLLQSQIVACRATLSLLEHLLSSLVGHSSVVRTPTGFLVQERFHISQVAPGTLEVSWEGNPLDDLVADSIIALLLSAEVLPSSVKASGSYHQHCSHETPDSCANETFCSTIKTYLEGFYGTIKGIDNDQRLTFSIDGTPVLVDLAALTVHCEDAQKQARVQKDLKKITSILSVDHVI